MKNKDEMTSKKKLLGDMYEIIRAKKKKKGKK